MNDKSDPVAERIAPLFQPVTPAHASVIPSSSPAFSTPIHPIQLQKHTLQQRKPTILPVLLPAATLRPLAFRLFTKKHNLTLNAASLQILANFIGKNCGSGWREEGLAENILDEAAKSWKRNNGGLIVEGDSKEFKDILHNLKGCISGGRLQTQRGRSRNGSFSQRESSTNEGYEDKDSRPNLVAREDRQSSLGISGLDVEDEEEQGFQTQDPRHFLKVVGAFDQPRLRYDAHRKHFEKLTTAPSVFPDPVHKTQLFRNRYHLIHQRLLRNESFQTPTIAVSRPPSLQQSPSTVVSTQQAYKLTPIANLLGRSGSSHVILGLLTIAPTGTLAISDLTGSISLDIQHARPIPEDGAWFTPGMMVIVDGIYEEESSASSSGLGGGGGIGGIIGGKFMGLSVGGPPCERREVTLGVGGANGEGHLSAGGGFGWVDFLGVGSERAAGSRMRKLEKTILGRRDPQEDTAGRNKIAILGENNLDNPKSMEALKKVLAVYAADVEEHVPITFVLVGNFVRHAVVAGGGSGGSIEYKEYFNTLASVLSEYPSILQTSTFVFVPGDNDPWASAFSAGAATVLPRNSIPDLFTSRIKRAFTTANAEAAKSSGSKTDGEVVWTTNPTRLTLFGSTQEIVVFRDDISSRLRRSALTFQKLDVNGSGEASPDRVSVDKNMSYTAGSDDQMELDAAVEDAESHVPASQNAQTNCSATENELQTARKLVKTILDQGDLSPFPLATRPVFWDHADALRLYPLPTALVLVDPEAPPYTVTYEGCHVMNPGRLVVDGRKAIARWIEFDARSRRGKIREVKY
ncbi:DNA-directed DNA polymerase epsilon, subunit B [Xylographa carneopallida]|nr:DNA-directed DNA polymerase epsilon, subunit B [Xylographa carneopallida]